MRLLDGQVHERARGFQNARGALLLELDGHILHTHVTKKREGQESREIDDELKHEDETDSKQPQINLRGFP